MRRKVLSITLIIALLLTCFTPSVSAASLVRVGSRGGDVKNVQKRLNELGFDCGRADGIFGWRTERAVRSFQRSRGLSADGIVGSKTRAALFESGQSNGSVSKSSSSSRANRSAPITSMLRAGSRGSQVVTLQKQLNKLGFNCGRADGIFGSGTRRAVMNFQRSRGLSVDGIAGPDTVSALFNGGQSTGSTSGTSRPNSSSSRGNAPIKSLLRVGSRGNQVKTLQKRLNELGYNCGKADGIFGSGTRRAVMNFQRANKLGVDGIVGPATVKALFKDDSQSSKPAPAEPKPTTPKEDKVPITSLLRVGSRGNQVKTLQKRLNELGYNCGKADGIFGSGTRRAVMNFQRANKLGVDGIVGPATVKALFKDDSQSSKPAPAEPKPTTPKEDKVPITSLLRVGSRGSQVKTLQKRLNELGYNCGKADGIFGSGTRRAVMNFQRANKLGVDGIVGPATVKALFKDDSQSSKPAPVEPKPTTPKEDKVPITSLLRVGSRGSQVKTLQKRLNELGYNCGKADGIFGSGTKNAVMKFQRANKLGVDGIVGPATVKALFKDDSQSSKPAPTEPKPEEPKRPVPNDDFTQFYGEKDALKGKIVVIDPGHGGTDPGASRQGIAEKDIVLDISLRLERILKDAGATVVMTRNKDVFEELYYRPALANKKMLQTEISKLTDEIETLEEEIQKLEDKIGASKVEAAKLSIAKADAQEHVAEKEKLENQINELQNKQPQIDYKALESNIEKLEEALSQTDCNYVDKSFKEIKDCLRSNDLTDIETNSDAQSNDDQQAIIEELVDGILSTCNSLTEQSSINDAKTIIVQYNEVEESIKDVEIKLAALENSEREIKVSLNAIDEEIVQTSVSEEELQRQIDSKNKKKKELEKERTKLKSYIKALDSNPKNLPKEVKDALFELAGTDYKDNMVFVSIHVNSTGADMQTGASGIRIYYTANSNHDEDARIKFAQTLLDELKKTTDFSKTSSSPYKSNLAVLREQNFVSALVEAGFINNPNDLQKLVEAQTREDIAEGIYRGIVAHFKNKK